MGTPSGVAGRGTSGMEDVGREEAQGRVAETAEAADAVVIPSGQLAAAVVGAVDKDEGKKTTRTPALQRADGKHYKQHGADPRWIPQDSVNVTRRLLDVKVRISRSSDIVALC